MLLLFVSLNGCGLYEWVTGTVEQSVANQGIEALDGARELVRQAEESPGRRRVLRVIRRLESEIDAGERSGLNGNLFAAAVDKVANDGTITSTEAGMVEDAFAKLLGGEIGRGKRGKRRQERRDAAASDEADPVTEN